MPSDPTAPRLLQLSHRPQSASSSFTRLVSSLMSHPCKSSYTGSQSASGSSLRVYLTLGSRAAQISKDLHPWIPSRSLRFSGYQGLLCITQHWELKVLLPQCFYLHLHHIPTLVCYCHIPVAAEVGKVKFDLPESNALKLMEREKVWYPQAWNTLTG